MKRTFNRFLKFIIIIVMMLGFISCATVPREVVDLSHTLGQDLSAIQTSYRQLIETYFESLRKQAEDFIQSEWAPVYLKKFIEKSELAANIQALPPGDTLKYLQVWTNKAMERIQNKKNELLSPINDDEKKLLEEVDVSFARLINANSVITAHLNSIRKVKELEDKALSGLGLKDLRDRIQDVGVKASKKLQKAIDAIKSSEDTVDLLDKTKKEIIEKIDSVTKEIKDDRP